MERTFTFGSIPTDRLHGRREQLLDKGLKLVVAVRVLVKDAETGQVRVQIRPDGEVRLVLERLHCLQHVADLRQSPTSLR